MINIIKEKLDISQNLIKKIVWTKNYTSTSITIVYGGIIRIEPSNLTYIEPHRIIINNTIFLAFNYSNEIFIENLSNKIKLSELEDYLKNIMCG